MTAFDRISANLDRVRSGIAAACARSGRSVDEVRLVAVTKYAQLDWVRDLISLGQTTLGESRPHQLASRADELAAEPGIPVEWHMIGHLQRNKVDLVLPIAALIHSVDSLRLAQRISTVAVTREKPAAVLIEVNVSGEDSKDGFAPDELRTAWGELAGLSGLDIRGLMTMAPRVDEPAQARPYFARLRALRDELTACSDRRIDLAELSMGMSGDYEAAIEEGATLVRVGSSLFEGLS
ncbi:YggS family pyridoxal phosphate-dependent enzyme [bacterium]|nr:YggS family pyridoxal phosphate-dependent enzyme [bacterium]